MHFNQNHSEIFATFAVNLPLLKRLGRKTFGIKNLPDVAWPAARGAALCALGVLPKHFGRNVRQ